MKASVAASVDILIITALGEEFDAIASRLQSTGEAQSLDNPLSYSFSRVTNGTVSYFVVTTCLFEMGNPDAGALAAGAIRELAPTYVIVFGLAGGIKDRVNLGDVIVSTEIYYYEPAKLRAGDTESRPLYIRTDAVLYNRLQRCALKLHKPYQVQFGPFAVGEKVVSDVATIKGFKTYVPKLLGIEMESYGVATAAHHSTHRPRFIAVRGVSDFADHDKNDDWRQRCLDNAADFLVEFLSSGTLPKEQYLETASAGRKTLIAIHHLSLERRTSIRNAVSTTLTEYSDHYIEEVLIDQTDLFRNGRLVEPHVALERQKDLVSRLDSLLREYPDAEIGYFGLAHIPLIFHAGYEINRREVRAFGTNRQTGEWQSLSESADGWSKISIEGLPTSSSHLAGDVVIRMSVSSEVTMEQVQGLAPNAIASVHLAIDTPRLDCVGCEDQLNEYALAFRQVLTDIQRLLPNMQKIYLFFAGPPTLAFTCGQQISKTMDPDVVVFNFSRKDQPNYRWGLNLCTGEILDVALTA